MLSPSSQVHTVAFGIAMGQACMLLASGQHGKRFMLPHTTGDTPACIPFIRPASFIICLCEPRNSRLADGLLKAVLDNKDEMLLRLNDGWMVTAMLQQPRVPTTGQRQAIEIQIKWREVLAQKQAFLRILSKHTGHSMQKLDAVRSTSPLLFSNALLSTMWDKGMK